MNIKIQTADKVLSPLGGLQIFARMTQATGLQRFVFDILPSLKSGAKRSYAKFSQILYAFIAGADCLDDLDRLGLDPAFRALCPQGLYTAKACGDFLRSFTAYDCKQLNQRLIDFSYSLRAALHTDKQRAIVIDIDSTTNKQHGKKMEGLAFNYKQEWGLDTICAFDEFGLPYWHEARPGDTYSSQGAELILHEIFERMPKDKGFRKLRRYVRGDSAFCHRGFFTACMAKDVGFVVAMKANIFKPLIHRVRNWRDTNPKNKKRIVFYDQRECQMGQTFYHPEGIHSPLRVVLIRAVKKGHENLTFKRDEDYDYYAFLTNIGEHEMSHEKLIKFYRGRGNAENFVKELKYGFDLKHYPCQKLNANKAYGLIACFAYALMRFISVHQNRRKPQYAKALRFRLLYLPCQVVHHAGQVIFKFMKHHYKEVQSWLEKIKNLQLGCT